MVFVKQVCFSYGESPRTPPLEGTSLHRRNISVERPSGILILFTTCLPLWVKSSHQCCSYCSALLIHSDEYGLGKGTCGLFRRPWWKQAPGKITLVTNKHDNTGFTPIIVIVLCQQLRDKCYISLCLKRKVRATHFVFLAQFTISKRV